MMLTKAHLGKPGHVFYSGSTDLLKKCYTGNFFMGYKYKDTGEKSFCSLWLLYQPRDNHHQCETVTLES